MIKVKNKPKKDYKDFKHFYSPWDLSNQSFYYYEKDGKDFMYIHDFKTFVIPDSSDLTVKEILDDKDLDYSNWIFTKLNEDLPYTKNQFKLCSSTSNWGHFDSELGLDQTNELVKKLSGTWELKDTDTGIKMEFSILPEDSYFFYLGFSEKTEVPFDRNKIMRKSMFITTLLELKNIVSQKKCIISQEKCIDPGC